MEKRTLGNTGLEVSVLGLGTAEIGIKDVDDAQADRLLKKTLDLGVNLLDTANCYGDGDSETRIGKALADRRDEFVLVSKCGHTVEGSDAAEWSPQIILGSAEASLRRLRTDHLDVLLLHSCGADVLESADILKALEKVRDDGKTRFIGYSGDNEAAEKAVAMGIFDVLETSVSVADQQAVDRFLPEAKQTHLGVLAKRAIANAAWRDLDQVDNFYADYARPYAERLDAMGLSPETVGFDGSWLELAMGFTLAQDGVTVAIAGTSNPEHLEANVRAARRGSLAPQIVEKVRELWRAADGGVWPGLE